VKVIIWSWIWISGGFLWDIGQGIGRSFGIDGRESTGCIFLNFFLEFI
jgi:hypothetical protein